MNTNSLTILNDGETFTGTNGSKVVEFDASNLPTDVAESLDNGDPREVVVAVLSKRMSGRVLNIEQLVELYDECQREMRALPPSIIELMQSIEQI